MFLSILGKVLQVRVVHWKALMTQSTPDFCFCTLAIGTRYRQHALLLAEDLEQYAPKPPFIVLTDKPQALKEM